MRGYTWQLSLDGGNTVYYTNSSSKKTSPYTGVYCPANNVCAYRMQAYFDSTTSQWSAWVSTPPLER